MHYYNNWFMGWMWMWWILIILAIVAVVWFLVSTGQKRRNASDDSPEQILKRRYARGEIDHETYERMLDELRK